MDSITIKNHIVEKLAETHAWYMKSVEDFNKRWNIKWIKSYNMKKRFMNFAVELINIANKQEWTWKSPFNMYEKNIDWQIKYKAELLWYAVDQYFKIYIKAKPKWMPQFIYKWIIKNIVNLVFLKEI